MSTVAADLRRGRLVRLLGFVAETHPPRTYLVFTGLWAISLLSLLASLGGGWRFAPEQLLVALSFFLVLLFLRAVDEIKDLDYDRLHKADRPLARGEVSVAEVWGLAAGVAVAVLGVNALLGWELVAFAALNMAYGLFLLGLERVSTTFRDSILLNLVVTFPVSAALNVHAFQYLHTRGQAPELALAVPAMAAWVCAFLHFEFGRKLKWPHLAAPGENGYAQVLGVAGAIAVCLLLGLGAMGLAGWSQLRAGVPLYLAALPALAFIGTGLGLMKFAGARARHRELKPWFALFLVSFFAANLLVRALAG